LLQEHERTGAFLKDLFPLALRELPPVDQALARALSLGILRHRSWLDWHLDRLAPKGISHPGLRWVLRLGAYQILVMDHIPVHAAVDTSVEIARRKFGKPLAGFANALLKNLSRQGAQSLPEDSPENVAIVTSHPLWLVKRWWRTLGPEAATAALKHSNQEAPAYLRVNPLRNSREEVLEMLRGQQWDAEPDALAPLFLKLKGQTEGVLRSELFKLGKVSFQDPAASFVATLLQWQPGQSAVDLCSAPGGKAALLLEMAAAAGHSLKGAGIVCADLSGRRLKSLRDVQQRLGHVGKAGSVWPVAQDGLHPALKGPFDRILADVPCSNLGVIGRRPEARWRLQEKELADHGRRQFALLESAARLLAPNGRLVYATCSPEPEETRDVIARFLKAHPDFHLVDAARLLPAQVVRAGCLHLYPGETDYDGFFGAALERKP
jgi:16S rRNA (cytosine967-C5)-methyltransferase